MVINMKSFVVNSLKCVIAAASSIFFFLMAAVMMPMHRPRSAAVFLLLGIIFACAGAVNGTVIRLDEGGVNQVRMGKKLRAWTWGQVAEIGVCGTKVFNRRNPEKTGTLYIYLSQERLSDEERFDMILKWPPRDKMYFVYSKERLEEIQAISGAGIESYNTGELKI